jgi:hypothetical protein
MARTSRTALIPSPLQCVSDLAATAGQQPPRA